MATARFMKREIKGNGTGIVLTLLGLGLFAYTLLITAWLCDDAYITYRTVDNFVNGHGLRWNVAERVQSYTHPLWFFLSAAAYAVTREHFFTFTVLSMAVSFAAVLSVVLGVARNWGGAVVALAALVFSRAFVDYSTSGLENPLSYLLIAAFLILYFRLQWSPRTLFLLSLVAGLAALNRMDSLLLFLPALAYAWSSLATGPGAGVKLRFNWPLVAVIAVVLTALLALLTWLGAPWVLIPLVLGAFIALRSARATLAVMLGMLPFVLWVMFSIIYYGFPFPNTAYAKLGTAIPSRELFDQGLHYLAHSWNRDPSTIVFMALGIGIGFFMRSWRVAMLSLGTLLYIAYVVKIGGDFMGGRFFAAPLLLAVCIIARLHLPVYSLRTWMLAIGAAVISMSQPLAPPVAGPDAKTDEYFKDENGIGDERRFWYKTAGFLAAAPAAPQWTEGLPSLIGTPIRNLARGASMMAHGPMKPMPSHKYVTEGQGYRDKGEAGPVRHGSVGFRGFFGGPGVYIVDYYALADPLLARLPAKFEANWRIGHFTRYQPEGYMEAAKGDASALKDPGLQEYYGHLLAITRGPLFDAARWRSIIGMNFGRYDHLRPFDSMRYPATRKLDISAVSKVKKAGTKWNAPGNITLNPGAGVQVSIGRTAHNSGIEFSFDNKDSFIILYLRGSELLGKKEVTAPAQPRGGLAVMEVPTPRDAVKRGYDTVRIYPVPDEKRKEDKFSMGHMRLL